MIGDQTEADRLRDLLTRYMAAVMNAESVSFLDATQYGQDPLSEEDRAALRHHEADARALLGMTEE